MTLRVMRWAMVVGVACCVAFMFAITKNQVEAAAPMAVRPGTTQTVSHVSESDWGVRSSAVFAACHPSEALGQYVRLIDRRTRWSVVVSVEGRCELPSGVDFGIGNDVAQALGVEPGAKLAVAVERVR